MDGTYGVGGRSDLVDTGADDHGRFIEALADDSVIVGGGGVSTGHIAARFLPNGTLDPAYGTAGVFGSGGGATTLGMVAREDGSVIIGGAVFFFELFAGATLVTPDGQRDTRLRGGTPLGSFGAVDIAAGNDNSFGMAIGVDGNLYMSASTSTNNGDVSVIKFDAAQIADYVDDTTADWDTAGNLNLFGACLAGVAGGASSGGGSWVVDTFGTAGDCAADDSEPWNAIDDDGLGASAKVAESTGSGTTNAQALIRFGLRTRSDEPPGLYSAPITFEAVAPNV